MSIISFSLFRFDSLRAKLWAFSQMGLAKPALRATPQIGFCKLMGTGAGAGFSTKPNFSVYTFLAEWPCVEVARKQMASTPIFNKYRDRAEETATVYLAPVSARGQWDGHEFAKDGAPLESQQTPIIAITRASIKLSALSRFWALVPAISDRAEVDSHRHFMIGTGELPWVHQVTFSVWDDVSAMDSFSKNSNTHGVAVKRAYDEGWFTESCFMRFNLKHYEGSWTGLNFLDQQNGSTMIDNYPDPMAAPKAAHGAISP